MKGSINQVNSSSLVDSQRSPDTSVLGGTMINKKQSFNFVDSFAEVVEEEKQEDDEVIRQLRRQNSRFKMVKDGNEFNKKSKRNRSIDYLKEKTE